ncbi:MAG: hypothetical protein ACXWDT_03180 [Solirubrobacterales bacterium]
MSPAPVKDPIPRFIADASQEALPYGRWAEQLRAELAKACEPLKAEAGGATLPEEIEWFPERGWGGRVYVPATAVTEPANGKRIEWFGYVSFVRPDEGKPSDFEAKADFTDVLAEDNPDWRVDLNEEVIGVWRGESTRAGDVTLVWGRPLVRGATAATAEVGGGVVDQTPVNDDRFSLVAVDAVKGFGEDLYLEVRIWSKRAVELAAESLYDEPE